jgi:hypothetical protein
MKIAKKLSFCLILFFLLFLPFNALATDSDSTGNKECPVEERPDGGRIPTIPGEVPNYFLWWEVLPNTIDPNSEELIAVGGHSPPFAWSFSGDGFSLKAPESYDPDNASQILVASEDACGTAEITVTDQFGIVITGEVRCSNGYWGERIGGCIMQGAGSSRGAGYVIRGRYKQTQHTTNLSGWYPHWGECPLDVCDNQCASNPKCDPDFGCEPCLTRDEPGAPCVNAGYAGTECPPTCRAWCICTTELYYQEWICPDEE